MNQERIGKFIYERRKEKNMTQEELANKLFISNKAVSKWENGKSLPDVSLFNSLCEILDITVTELLSGEKDNKSNKVTIDLIKYYDGKSKRKILFTLIGGIAILLISILSLYMLNNFNKCKIYSLNTSNEEFLVSGYLITNQQNQILTINRLDYNFDNNANWCFSVEEKCPDIYTEDLSIDIMKNETIIKSIKIDELNTDTHYLSTILKDITIDLTEKNNNAKSKIESDTFRIIINYNVYKDDTIYPINLDIALEMNELYANNKIFY